MYQHKLFLKTYVWALLLFDPEQAFQTPWTLFVDFKPNATSNSPSSVCCDPQTRRTKFHTLCLNPWPYHCWQSRHWLNRRSSLLSVWVTKKVFDNIIKRRNDTWYVYAWIRNLLRNTFTTYVCKYLSTTRNYVPWQDFLMRVGVDFFMFISFLSKTFKYRKHDISPSVSGVSLH